MSGLTPAPAKRVHDPSLVATHGVALWSAGDSPFRSVRIVMALLVPCLRLALAKYAERARLFRERCPTRVSDLHPEHDLFLTPDIDDDRPPLGKPVHHDNAQKFVACHSRSIAARKCPWAFVIAAVDGGFMCFESRDVYQTIYQTWKRQT
jgi:hypothetical protein